MACLEGLAGESLFSIKNNMAAQLRFWNNIWNNVLWAVITKIEMFGNSTTFGKNQTQHASTNTLYIKLCDVMIGLVL